MPQTYTQLAESIRTWLSDTYTSMYTDPTERQWCLLGITDILTPSNIDTYFDSSVPNKAFDAQVAAVAQAKTLTNVPVAQLQLEADNIYSLAKSMVYRHQPRLRNYRDDIENKDIRTSTSIAISLGRYNLLQAIMKGT